MIYNKEYFKKIKIAKLALRLAKILAKIIKVI